MFGALQKPHGRNARSSSPVVRRPNLRGSILRGREQTRSNPSSPEQTPQQFQLTPELGSPPEAAAEMNTSNLTQAQGRELAMQRLIALGEAERKGNLDIDEGR